MMRSLYSGVSGLKVHQTKMDVIGNNISNVNTIGFKSSSTLFSDILYQTSSAATGPNAATGMAGMNAMQIGLGANLLSITTNISRTGGSQRTDNWSDLMIEGDSFFIVKNNGANYFTKAGSFNVDANGNLCTPSGALVMGWQPDPDNPSKCRSDTVSALRVMGPDNLRSEPEATTNVHITGNIDQNDTQLDPEGEGRIANVQFYDNLGNLYTAELRIRRVDTEGDAEALSNQFTVKLHDIYKADGKSLFVSETVADDGTITYSQPAISINLGGQEGITPELNEEGGSVAPIMGPEDEGIILEFNSVTGRFVSIGEAGDDGSANSITFQLIQDGGPFVPIDVDFSSLTMFSQSGTTTLECSKGSKNDVAVGAGRPFGSLSELTIDKYGKIYGTYDNGDQNLLGQIAVATFANPAGLEAVGNNMYATTQNSGEFDGIGKDIATTGGKFNSGVVEMSNVDLANEFTDMITTQRGFQANSRIITTSDTLLEELINLKR